MHWGNRFIELQNDDLEATWDYTEEGVTALEVYLIFAESLAKDGNSSGYWIEPMARNNKFSYAYNLINPPPGSAEGLYRESKPGDFDTIETITNPASFTGGYLSARILNVPWKHDLIPYRIEFNPIYIKHFSQSSAGFKTIDLPDENGTNFQGHIERKRLRLVATRPDHEPFSMDCVKVTDETEFWHGDFLANVTSESLTLTIPKGKLFSDWIETAAPMGTNKDFAQYIVPCDIVVVFGKGPGGFVGNQSMTSRAYLEQYLATIKIAKHGNNWVVREESGLHSGIKIAEDENSLIQALSTPTTTVVFDGHANFGLGPNFSLATHKTIGSFTNFGTGDKTATPDHYTNETPDTYATGIPITYRGDGTEPDVLSEFLGHSPRAPENEVAFGQMAEEGWVYLVPDSTEIKGSVTNFTIPHMDGRWKFESAYGTSAGATLAKSGSGLGEFHYVEVGQSPRLIVSAPKDDLPPLRYKRLFYNSCSSGPHFIANFEHGEFIYTNRACHVFRATQVFLEGLLNNNPINQILEDLNQPDVGDEDPEFDIYKIATF